MSDRPLSDRKLSEEEFRNEVIHRRNLGESERRIARQLNVSRWLVTKVIRQNRKSRGLVETNSLTSTQRADSTESIPGSLGQPIEKRASKLDAFEPQLRELLERYPRITVIRLQEELRVAGYTGGYSILAQRVRELRARPTKPLTVRFETGPGAQAQMDWATYEIDFRQEGRRKVQLFSYILGYSRRQYIHFTARQDFETTIGQHIEAFKHLGGVAATCLYDNMKVVVTRWEDDCPIYNTRFLAFATHYGYRPWACQVRRPQTKGKVERPFYYIETNLLGGRQFRSLEHLNETARWWLAEVADKRIHGTTKKTPLELHAGELPHLLPLPALQFDTAQVVYRVVSTDGTIQVASNHYSVPWQRVADLLPVRILETELVVYNQALMEIARHVLLVGQTGQRRIDPGHLPPRDHEAQMQLLRERYTTLGEVAVEFLSGLLARARYSKHHAQKILTLLNVYPKSDVLAAMQRAVMYRAFGYSELERILAHQGTPKPSWQQLSQSEQETIDKLTESKPIPARHSQEYQDLLYGKSQRPPELSSPEIPTQRPPHEPQENDVEDNDQNQSPGSRTAGDRSPSDDSQKPSDAQDQAASTGA
jgi:transposase